MERHIPKSRNVVIQESRTVIASVETMFTYELQNKIKCAMKQTRQRRPQGVEC